MAVEYAILRIRANRLGTVTELITLLSDLEIAYNGLYVFDEYYYFLTNGIWRVESPFKAIEKEFPDNKVIANIDVGKSEINFSSVCFSFEMDSKNENPFSKATISNIKSQRTITWLWEVIGSLNPLAQLREYLKDFHERKKDRNYRNRQEEELKDLEILEKKDSLLFQRVAYLKDAGYSDEEIKGLVKTLLIDPLNKLAAHQDNGLIEGPEE